MMCIIQLNNRYDVILIRTCLARPRKIGGCARRVSLIGHRCSQKIPHQPPCLCSRVTSANSVAAPEFSRCLIYPQAHAQNAGFKQIQTQSQKPVFILKGMAHV